MEFTLLAAVAMGVVGVYAALWWEARRGNAAECTTDLWDLALMATVAGVFVGRLAAVVDAGVNPLTHPADIVIVRAGVHTGWAAVAALTIVVWKGRNDFVAVTDGLAAAALAGLAGWHAGCLARASCLGTATDLPWAVHQTGSDIGRHPVELYAAAAFLVGAIAIGLLRARGLPPGMAASAALLMAGMVRLATEPLRPSLDGGPVAWYGAAAAVGFAGIVIAAESSRRRRRREIPPEPPPGILGDRDFFA